jgi:hypothetical protein
MKLFGKTQNYALAFDQTITTPQEFKFPVDASAKKIKGIALVPRTGTITNLLIKYNDNQNGMVLDYAPLSLYAISSAYPVADRFVPLDLAANKQNLVFTLQVLAAGVGTGTIDIILALD